MATQATGEPIPGVVGTTESFTVTGLGSSTTYYFALKTRDEVPSWSLLSNCASNKTTETPDTNAPAEVTDLATSNPTLTSIDLTWTAPADNGTDATSGNATQYDIRYLAGSTPITDANWASAAQCTGEPTPSPAGTSESFVVNGLTPSTQYYFALKTSDEVPDWSSISNSSNATTFGSGGPQLIIVSPGTVDENTNFDVTVTANGNPIEGVKVTFNSVNKTTDANGKAAHTTPSVAADTQYTITANKTGYADGTKTITVKNISAILQLSVTANPTTVESGGNVSIVMKVTSSGLNISGATLSLSDGGAGGTFTSVSEKGNGEYAATYTAPIMESLITSPNG